MSTRWFSGCARCKMNSAFMPAAKIQRWLGADHHLRLRNPELIKIGSGWSGMLQFGQILIHSRLKCYGKTCNSDGNFARRACQKSFALADSGSLARRHLEARPHMPGKCSSIFKMYLESDRSNFGILIQNPLGHVKYHYRLWKFVGNFYATSTTYPTLRVCLHPET